MQRLRRLVSANHMQCSLHLADTPIPEGIEWGITASAEQILNQCSIDSTFPVAAGNHTVDLVVAGLAGGDQINAATLSVLFIPFGADGTQPTP